MTQSARLTRERNNERPIYKASARGRLSSGDPNPIDVHIGQRIRSRRVILGHSMAHLASALNVTFQQIQKYESGQNRLGATRLWQVSRALGCPVDHFFEEMSAAAAAASPRHLASAKCDPETAQFPTPHTQEILRLARAYSRIARTQVRRRFLDLATSLASL